MIEQKLWEKAVSMNDSLKEAIMNPNTDFMTKLIFDAHFLSKKFGNDVAYWSNAVFSLKMFLHENGATDSKSISKKLKLKQKETTELLNYLKGMAEVSEEKGKYSLNYSNLFSKVFQG